MISANIRRRHLTNTQRAELIVKAIAAGKNDPANLARSFSPAPGRAGGSTKDPALDAAVIEGAKVGISKRTIQRARTTVGLSKNQSARKPKSTGVWTPAQLEKARAAHDRRLAKRVAKRTAKGEAARKRELQRKAADLIAGSDDPRESTWNVSGTYAESFDGLQLDIAYRVSHWRTRARAVLPAMLRDLADIYEKQPVQAVDTGREESRGLSSSA